MGRRLGQHFLSNKLTAQKIIQSAELTQKDTVIEIGPGRGILTELLIPCVKELVAVEVDYKLANYLKNKFSGAKNFSVLNEDFLRFKQDKSKNVKFVANLPYYITSPILQKISNWPSWNSAVVMIQKEVAERLIAKPQSSDYGILTISIGLKAKTEKLFNVPQSDFSPPPKVMSGVIRMAPHCGYDFSGINEKGFYKLLHACFGQKRKILANSVSGILSVPKDAVFGILEKLGLSRQSRAEDLSIQNYLDFYRQFELPGGS